MDEYRKPFWWVRLAIDFEQYYGPFEIKAQAERFTANIKDGRVGGISCDTEVLQDHVIDNGYLECTGGSVGRPAHYIVFRSGRVLPYSDVGLQEWVKREYGL